MRNLARVVIAHHVIGEDHVALLGEIDTARGNGCDLAVFQAAVDPVAVRRDDGREAALGRRLERAIEMKNRRHVDDEECPPKGVGNGSESGLLP